MFFVHFRSKNLQLSRLHYHLSTNLGLIQSNMTWLYKKRGPKYHWLTDLFKRMELPILSGVSEVLQNVNVKRMKLLQYYKRPDVKLNRKKWKVKRRVQEKRERENWRKMKGDSHNYMGSKTGDVTPCPTRPIKPVSKSAKSCKCGSITHFKTTNTDCPLNKRKNRSLVNDESVELITNSSHDGFGDSDDHFSIKRPKTEPVESENNSSSSVNDNDSSDTDIDDLVYQLPYSRYYWRQI